MSTRIELHGLTKRFPGLGKSAIETTAVDAVDLRIEAGELFFLLGPSGCGKTTLLRMIAGFIEPTAGRIVFVTADGRTRDVTHEPANRRNTGMVFQSYALWPHMTVAANVAFGLDVRKVPAEEKASRVREALAAVRMEEYGERKPTQLSGGQQQRVALARALVVRPDVLLLDEPLSNLDAKLRIELRSEIRRICKTARGGSGVSVGSGGGITAVYVTHDQKEALSMADRVAIVNRGRIEQLGGPAELYRRPRTRFVAEFLGETNCLEGTLVERHSDGRVAVQTAAGRLESRCVSPALLDSATKVTVSVRPEALRLGVPDGTNTMFGRVRESVYLGELAQVTLDVQGGVELRASTMNPGSGAGDGGDRVNKPVTVSVSPEDVVVLGG